MPLPPQTQWTLTVCALIAHADGVLDGAECDRLLGMIEERVEGEEYSEWLTLFADREALRRKLVTLPPLDRHARPGVLEHAWLMALVDGDRSEPELAALHEIADRIGVDPAQLDRWRADWRQRELAFSEGVTSGAAFLLGAGTSVSDPDRTSFAELVEQLPTTTEHREELQAMWVVPSGLTEVVESLGSLGDEARAMALRLLSRLVIRASRSKIARAKFVELAAAAGIDDAAARAMLDRVSQGNNP